MVVILSKRCRLAEECSSRSSSSTTADDHKNGGSGLAPWPARLITPLPRLVDFGYSNEMFEKDTEVWRQRVDSYWNHLSPKVSSDTVRNVMDMKANLGLFAAALKDKNVGDECCP